LPFIICVGILCITLVVLAVAFLVKPVSKDPNYTTLQIFYKDPVSNTVEAEERTVPNAKDSVIAADALNMFISNPKSQHLQKAMPDDVTIVGTPTLVEGAGAKIFEIEFSREYYNIVPLDEVLLRASLVYTMTALDFVGGVRIRAAGLELTYSNGVEMGVLDRGSIDINPVIEQNAKVSVRFKLFFANEEGTGLMYEWRQIVADPTKSTEYYIVDELLKGPQTPGRYATISQDVKINEINTENGICYVNLSADFMNKNPSNKATEMTQVYSIVNSLIDLSDQRIRTVQFLIDSETATQPKGSVDLSRPFGRGDDIITADDEENP
jgi:germination protein M